MIEHMADRPYGYGHILITCLGLSSSSALGCAAEIASDAERHRNHLCIKIDKKDNAVKSAIQHNEQFVFFFKTAQTHNSL